MIKSAVKNYFQYFKYVFSAMGIVYLAALIVIFALSGGIINILSKAIEGSVEQFSQYLNNTLPLITLEKLFEKGFIWGFLNEILQIFIDSGANVVIQAAALASGLLTFFLFMCKIAAWHTRRLIKKDVSDSETKRGILVMIVKYLFSLAATVIAVILILYWVYSALFLLVAFAVLKACEQLTTTWYVYFKKSFRLKEMFKTKHILQIIVANTVSIAVNIAIIALIAVIVNLFFALLVAVPLIVYNFVIVDFSTVSYFHKIKALKSTEHPQGAELVEVPETAENARIADEKGQNMNNDAKILPAEKMTATNAKKETIDSNMPQINSNMATTNSNEETSNENEAKINLNAETSGAGAVSAQHPVSVTKSTENATETVLFVDKLQDSEDVKAEAKGVAKSLPRAPKKHGKTEKKSPASDVEKAKNK